MSRAVVWHDLECGSYDADLPLWRELARPPVLDVGAGTGRVALDLARHGVEVVALDRDEALLAALRERAGDLPVRTVAGDARGFDLGAAFATILCPMQTVQLLGGPDGRAAFLAAAAAHLPPGGVLACALADAREAIGESGDAPPRPDMREAGGWVFASRPIAVRDEGDRAAIVRVREIVDPAGARTEERDVVRLDHLAPALLEAEAAEHGLRALARRRIGATEDHIGSEVVVLTR